MEEKMHSLCYKCKFNKISIEHRPCRNTIRNCIEINFWTRKEYEGWKSIEVDSCKTCSFQEGKKTRRGSVMPSPLCGVCMAGTHFAWQPNDKCNIKILRQKVRAKKEHLKALKSVYLEEKNDEKQRSLCYVQKSGTMSTTEGKKNGKNM